MRLTVVKPAILSKLPQSLLNHQVEHGYDFYHKKHRPFAKVAVPPGYVQNQTLCEQFGIVPHSLLCMDSALWRQQIIKAVTFDIPRERIQIDFISGTSSRYSLAECQLILDCCNPTNPESPQPSNATQICSRMTQRLLSQLDGLQELLKADQKFAIDLDRLCGLSSYQLSILKKSVRPYSLRPTNSQLARDALRAQQKATATSAPKRHSKKKRSSNLGIPKTRKRPKSSPVMDPEDKPSPETQSAEAYNLAGADLHKAIHQLAAYRTTLLDLFQTIVLGVLRVELPIIYPLWIVQSEIDCLRKRFELHAIRFAKILADDHTLDRFRLHSCAGLQPLSDLERWCEAVAVIPAGQLDPVYAASGVEDELLSSADTSLTSLNEPSTGMVDQAVVHDSLTDASKTGDVATAEVHWPDYKSEDAAKHEHCQSEDICMLSQAVLPVPPFWTEPTSPGRMFLHRAETKDGIDSDSAIPSHRNRTPPLSPSSKTSARQAHWAPAPPDSIFHFPILALEQELLLSIRPERERELAVELSMRLADDRLAIDDLEITFRTLSLLEEERVSREEFAGISRLSDIITSSRLTGGWGEGNRVDVAQDVMIKGALDRSNKRAADGNRGGGEGVTKVAHRPPSKGCELRRQLCKKRRTWLAVTRRLDRQWINEGEHANDKRLVWPEPIFLKHKGQKKRSAEQAGRQDAKLEPVEREAGEGGNKRPRRSVGSAVGASNQNALADEHVASSDFKDAEMEMVEDVRTALESMPRTDPGASQFIGLQTRCTTPTLGESRWLAGPSLCREGANDKEKERVQRLAGDSEDEANSQVLGGDTPVSGSSECCYESGDSGERSCVSDVDSEWPI